MSNSQFFKIKYTSQFLKIKYIKCLTQFFKLKSKIFYKMHVQKYIVKNNFSMHINVKHNMIHIGIGRVVKKYTYHTVFGRPP